MSETSKKTGDKAHWKQLALQWLALPNITRDAIEAALRADGAPDSFISFELPAMWHAATEGETPEGEGVATRAEPPTAEPEKDDQAQGLQYRQFSHAILPAEAVIKDGRVVIPVELARLGWMFAPSARRQHAVELGENSGEKIVVGDAEHPALRTPHLVLLTALYAEAQRGGMEYVQDGPRVYLRIRTSYGRLLGLLHPGATIGGSGVVRLEEQLAALRDTPVLLPTEGSKSKRDVRFIESVTKRGAELEILLGNHWTQPFLEDEELHKTKSSEPRPVKPLLWHVLRDMPGAINKPTYLHMDWVLSDPTKVAHLTYREILKRTGALDAAERKTAKELNASQQRRQRRLDGLGALDGAPLSSGQTLHIRRADARGGYQDDYKIAGAVSTERLDAYDKGAAEVVAVHVYVSWLEHWHTTPTALRRTDGRYRPTLPAQTRLAA